MNPRLEGEMSEQELKPVSAKVQGFNLFAGVILPAISITLEATTHITAMEFFDPLPTAWHLMLVVFVPLAQLHVWFIIRRGATRHPFLAELVNAVVIGISLFYSIVYLPLMPFGAMLLIIGLGLLPLTPLLSLVAAIVMSVQLKRVVALTLPQRSSWAKVRALLLGLIVTTVLITAIELPASITRYGLQMAASQSAETRAKGIQFLRTWGSKDYLLRACYDRSGRATDLIGFLFSVKNPLPTSESRAIYYRVTGETFDASLPPKRVGGRFISQDSVEFDRNHGSENVGHKLNGLSLSSSRFDASADADGGVAYMQWTLSFDNDSDVQREARAEVQLPPGGVVSRLTLWVNGEEREAAFAGRSKVKEAYQQIAIRQRRDPVLVTTAGRDRILVQCFPVQPHGEMKIRVGITAPLMLDDKAQAKFLFPRFIQRNFLIPDDVRHAFWVEAKTPMASSFKAKTSGWEGQRSTTMHGRINDLELSSPESSITIARGNVNDMWSKDPFGPRGFVVQQSIQERAPQHMNRIVLVVDTSAVMSKSVLEIIEAVRSMTDEVDLKLVLTNIEGVDDGAQKQTFDGVWAAGTGLSSASFEGGADNVPALLHAWDLAASKPGNNAIVWVHGPQPVELYSVEELRQRWERRPYGPTLYSVPTGIGSDELEKKLDGVNELKSVPRTGTLSSDLQTLFGRLTGKIKTFEYVRSSKKLDPEVDLLYSLQTSDHLARLWANDEVARILAARDDSLNDAASMLAVNYQLVTPVSGAVVLETAAQYSATGLQPVDAGTVPTIPEPEMVILIAIVVLFLSWLIYRKWRAQGIGCPI